MRFADFFDIIVQKTTCTNVRGYCYGIQTYHYSDIGHHCNDGSCSGKVLICTDLHRIERKAGVWDGPVFWVAMSSQQRYSLTMMCQRRLCITVQEKSSKSCRLHSMSLLRVSAYPLELLFQIQAAPSTTFTRMRMRHFTKPKITAVTESGFGNSITVSD